MSNVHGSVTCSSEQFSLYSLHKNQNRTSIKYFVKMENYYAPITTNEIHNLSAQYYDKSLRLRFEIFPTKQFYYSVRIPRYFRHE
ncbi:hypothetical protein V1478_005328 [Vespula squamosa]|uniref:Uncharacterized protein n=1 Tax=Vespula squamosa TaxID=30214 RepID=A0ABD2BE04_VESSQ